MITKDKLRKKFLLLRKKKYFEVNPNIFNPLLNYIKKKYKKKDQIILCLYYPVNYEFNILKIFKNIKFSKIITLLPVIKKKNNMKFLKWKNKDILKMNKFGILEPLSSNKSLLPDIILVPLLAYDDFKSRLGYGKGYYDKLLGQYIKQNKEVETIGIGFSFQKYHKLPSKKHDIGLDKIFTEKGLK